MWPDVPKALLAVVKTRDLIRNEKEVSGGFGAKN